eukprot:Awhi_evm1s11722
MYLGSMKTTLKMKKSTDKSKHLFLEKNRVTKRVVVIVVVAVMEVMSLQVRRKKNQ